MTQLVKALRSGQITIPSEFREKLGIDEDSFLQINLIEGELRIKPVKISQNAGDSQWFKKLYDEFTPVRKEAKKYTEKEINKSIDKAIKAVRKSNAKGSN